MWRYDGKCGWYYPLPDGTPSQCDPDGDKPCCSRYGWCGSTTEHCSCSHSGTNYTRIHRDWKESNGTQRWRHDGKCGRYNPLPDGSPGQCDPDGEKPCCDNAWYGECGKTADHCYCGNCIDYKWEKSGRTQRWRRDGKCGMYYPLPDGTPGQCDPDGDKPCCSSSRYGRCGKTAEHCACSTCTDYKFLKDWLESGRILKWRYDGKCGFHYPLPDGSPGQCDPDGDKPCCKYYTYSYGECGNTAEHCSCSTCTNYTTLYRKWRESRYTLKWRYDGKCGMYYPLPDGTPGQCDPDGEKPCCNHRHGECGNTADHCSEWYSTNYSRIYREWEESGGTQKWRNDSLCGRYYTLPDGTPAECKPKGEYPCCDNVLYGRCGNTKNHCLCKECINFASIYKQWKKSGGTQKWRYDGRCGRYNPLPDGTVGQCDPEGDKPCCKHWPVGECGNTAEHCSCRNCTNYTRIYSEWEESNGTQRWRHDGKCGSRYPLPDGTRSQCDPDGDKPCCSDVWDGECGNTARECSCFTCTNYARLYKRWYKKSGVTKKWRYDRRCGSNYTLPDGTPAQCDPDGKFPCCTSEYGWCGNEAWYCSCRSCTNYTRLYRDWEESGGSQKWRYDGKCGIDYFLPDGTPGQCDPDGDKPCCNGDREYCVNTTEYCPCKGCTDYKLLKQWKESNGTQKWRYDGKCGMYYRLPDGTPGQCDPDGDKPCCSNAHYGECGNTTRHCSCDLCANYARIYRDWRESNGTQKWRYDGKCGMYYRLPDGTPGQCDRDGDKPCCSSSWDGKCGNTERECSCWDCKNYKFAKWWRESGGTQKWRNDSRCGSVFPLPDGTSAQCDPDGDKPCCSSSRYGRCGKTAEHCACSSCTDYKFAKWWRESGGTQKWRNDSTRCGSVFPLPDGTPAQCDPDGDKPCCSSGGYGRCGSTTEHCSCTDCTNYTRIYRDWEESGGAQKWRYDGKCGDDYPLPDGTPAQCDPDGDKPCCKNRRCGNSRVDCLCTDCLDYRLCRNIKKSRENCTLAKIHSGFLKYVCFDEVRKHIYYKCINSDDSYIANFDYQLNSVSEACKNDPLFYQACGFITKITNTKVLCGGFISDQKIGGKHKYIELRGDNCSSKSSHQPNIESENRINIPDYKSGVSCETWRGRYEKIPVHWICDGYEDCDDGSDEQGCTVTNSTVHMCTHYKESTLTVPILRHTRCSVFDLNYEYEPQFPYCLNYLDQTNCSDRERVGGYCKVNGFMSSVSKDMVCYEQDKRSEQDIKLCDDGIQNKCLSPSTSDCRVHKHLMCDGVEDCPDGSDETHQMCRLTTGEANFACKRRFQPNSGRARLPISWIMDHVTDCMNGEDENSTLLVVCPGNAILPAEFPCQNVFSCPGSNSSVPLRYLCNGVDSCGNGAENEVCTIARDFPLIDTIASTSSELIRNVCISVDCEQREFIRPWGSVLETKMEFMVPTEKVTCSKIFGEYYLYLSCMGLCLEANISCPLSGENRKLQYDSCRGQYPGRAYTLGNNSYLTFVLKSENGHFHQNVYRCNNARCIEYNQVCDLVDDCGDMSDEINCANNMICENTKNSTRHQFIAMSQKCDGIYDCFDLSDECNGSCERQILENWVLKCVCWLMGILAVILNVWSLIHGLSSLRNCQTAGMLTSKVLLILIALGDLLMGMYLIILSVFDSFIYREEFCKVQTEWLTGTACMVLGVISTVGSQVSLFSMTVFSFIRMYGLVNRSMRIPGPVNKKSLTKVIVLGSAIIISSLAVALLPLVPSLEDYFVQGMFYDPSYQVFVGFPTKGRHIDVLKAYYNYSNSSVNQVSADMSWKDIGEKVDNIFSQNYGYLDRRPVHFYGNDGVCLFKYFVRTDDARRSRKSPGSGVEMNDPVVWTMLTVNLICFIIMTCCYIRIIRNTRQSTQTSGQCDNLQRLRENRAMERRIMVIIGTDFMCWVPFIFISGLHNLGVINGSVWYTSFAMTVLPLNSVINPLIYDKAIGEFIMRNITMLIGFIISRISSAMVAITGLFRTRNMINQPEIIPMEIMNPQRDNE